MGRGVAAALAVAERACAGKTPPPGQPGIFSLGPPGVLEHLLAGAGFVGVERRTVDVPLRMPSAAEALTMMREAFGAYRAVINDSPEAVQAAAWAEVAETLTTFETSTGFVAPAEVLVAAGAKAASDGLSHRPSTWRS